MDEKKVIPTIFVDIRHCSASDVIVDIDELADYWKRLIGGPQFALTIGGPAVYCVLEVHIVHDDNMHFFIRVEVERNSPDDNVIYAIDIEFDVARDNGEDYIGDTRGTYHKSHCDVRAIFHEAALEYLLEREPRIVEEAYTCINRVAASRPECVKYLEELLQSYPHRPRPAVLAKGQPTPMWRAKPTDSDNKRPDPATKKSGTAMQRNHVSTVVHKNTNMDNDEIEVKEDPGDAMEEVYDDE